jgi:hypothetical protein
MRKPTPQPALFSPPPSALCSSPNEKAGIDAPGHDVALPRDATPATRIAEAVERIAAYLAESTSSGEHDLSVIQALPPEALSMPGAAQFLGVSQATLKQLVRTRKLAYVQLGSQRGRVFLVEDLRNFLKENRQATAEELASKRRRA